ncbi:hypothetical protein HPB51_016562 [Rhipicephalus microplus]|uniref:Uncharacterized protein n=1 Tax=Rhipicephalus microplus TaxID=6941 RepID=A0A9J6EAL8_RHIMP|nr:hypothetical protein HPB51_016562 [Rhipicephalus microplus]
MVVQQDAEPPPSAAEEKGEKKHKLRQRFQVIRKLGQGTYGKVQLAINRATNQEPSRPRRLHKNPRDAWPPAMRDASSPAQSSAFRARRLFDTKPIDARGPGGRFELSKSA